MDSIIATKRAPAPRLARPAARYWKGKLPKGVDAQQDLDSDDEAAGEDEQDDVKDIPIGGSDSEDEDDGGNLAVRAHQVSTRINVALKDVDISADGKVTVAGRTESGKTEREDAQQEESDEESDEEEPQASVGKVAGAVGAESGSSSEYETDSEEEDEEEKKPVLQFRPVFVPKRQRVTVAQREKESQDSEEAYRKHAEIEAARKKASHDMVGDSIRRAMAEKETEEVVHDVDDTDGLDPDAEFDAWRLRELGRIKRDKEEEMRMEKEREEVERRRALPEEQRLKEDLERAQKLREEKPKGQQKFLQKYHHKGAFHQDAEVLTRHDFTAPTESTVDISNLPKVMQVKNFGKRSQTKYTHLLDQDTTVKNGGFGGADNMKTGGKHGVPGAEILCFICGGPHMKRDCPQFSATGPNDFQRRDGGSKSGQRGWDESGGPGQDRGWGGRPTGPPPADFRKRSRSPSRRGPGRRSRSRSRSPDRGRDEKRFRR